MSPLCVDRLCSILQCILLCLLAGVTSGPLFRDSLLYSPLRCAFILSYCPSVLLFYGRFCSCHKFPNWNLIGCNGKREAFGQNFLLHFSEFTVKDVSTLLSWSGSLLFFQTSLTGCIFPFWSFIFDISLACWTVISCKNGTLCNEVLW